MGTCQQQLAQTTAAKELNPRIAQRDVHRQQKWLWNVLCCIHSICLEAELLSH
jgi:hypothetical protein